MQKNKYIATIYENVLKHKSVRDIHKELLKVTLNPNKPLLAYMSKVAQKAKRLDKGKGQYYDTGGIDVLAIALLNLFRQSNVDDKSHVLINSEVRKYESESKAEILKNSWKENRENGKIFYIASKHADSATDHEPYQGKVYVDRFWHNYDKDGRLADYIRRNNIKTVQWVTGKPVWFVTRPNCRHYFTNYDIESVLNNNYRIPTRKIGEQAMKTPRDMTLEKYQDRLRLLYALQRKHETDLLRRQIEKTRLLISKWKKMV